MSVINISDMARKVNDMPDALPGDANVARAALIRDGNADLLPYFFGGDAA